MSLDTQVHPLLAIVFTMANLAFVVDRILFVCRPTFDRRKRLDERLLVRVVPYFVAAGFAALIEVRALGRVHALGWSFYAATLCLFVLYAFAGFLRCCPWRVPARGGSVQP